MVHNIEYIDKYELDKCTNFKELDKCTNFKDLLEIHRFYKIWSEIQQNIERNPQNVKDFRANIANITNITNLEFRIDLNWQI